MRKLMHVYRVHATSDMRSSWLMFSKVLLKMRSDTQVLFWLYHDYSWKKNAVLNAFFSFVIVLSVALKYLYPYIFTHCLANTELQKQRQVSLQPKERCMSGEWSLERAKLRIMQSKVTQMAECPKGSFQQGWFISSQRVLFLFLLCYIYILICVHISWKWPSS